MRRATLVLLALLVSVAGSVVGSVAHAGAVQAMRLPLAVSPARTTATATVPAVVKKYGAGSATQIITVTAVKGSSTTASLSAWVKSGASWKRVAGPYLAHLGYNGVGKTSERLSRTPAGSFTMTQAFGYFGNPGTKLPYRRTTPADFWVEQVGNKYYNTWRSCPSMKSSACGFTPGDPSEHLYYETPYYNYAVVIDYNTANAPGGIKQGAGSGFFLHVTDGGPTAGCVAITQSQLVKLMTWIDPKAHPRIIIGTK
jgi:L,D-peptidoglycan transpeptidase YkuD (ErfK/YbiS/YcfS/YnhG family)